MLFDFLVVYGLAGIFVYALAYMLNKKFFKVHPVTKLKAALISFAVFIILTIFFTVTMYLRQAALGLPVNKPFDLSAISYVIFFYWMLVKAKTKFEIVTEKGGFVASFDSKAEAEEYLAKNADKKYKIK
jgi:hypothetical protein